MIIEIDMGGAPDSEYSSEFARGCAVRMATSYYKYGKVEDATKVDKIESALARIVKYEQTGNTEFLLDASNFLMMEWLYPAHENAHFKATDSKESVGRTFYGEVDPSQRGNKEI